jgi:hypothetical protein
MLACCTVKCEKCDVKHKLFVTTNFDNINITYS